MLFSTSGCGDSTSSGGTGGTSGTGPVETPDNVAGDYLVSLTSGENTCKSMADTWVEGAMTEGVQFSITQKGVQIEAETMGASAIYVLVLTGANDFTGEIHDSHFVLTNHGTKMYSYLTCDYTINAVVEGDLDGDSIVGTLTYKPVITDNPDCGDYDCAAEQAFTGTRPSG